MKTVKSTFQANLSFCDNFLQCLSLYVCSIAVDRIQNYTQLTVCYCSQYATFFVFLDLMPLSSYLVLEKKFFFVFLAFFGCHVIMHAKLFLLILVFAIISILDQHNNIFKNSCKRISQLDAFDSNFVDFIRCLSTF